jgi:hypothetical protein
VITNCISFTADSTPCAPPRGRSSSKPRPQSGRATHPTRLLQSPPTHALPTLPSGAPCAPPRGRSSSKPFPTLKQSTAPRRAPHRAMPWCCGRAQHRAMLCCWGGAILPVCPTPRLCPAKPSGEAGERRSRGEMPHRFSARFTPPSAPPPPSAPFSPSPSAPTPPNSVILYRQVCKPSGGPCAPSRGRTSGKPFPSLTRANAPGGAGQPWCESGGRGKETWCGSLPRMQGGAGGAILPVCPAPRQRRSRGKMPHQVSARFTPPSSPPPPSAPLLPLRPSFP